MITRVSTRTRFVLAGVLLIVPLLVAAATILNEGFKRSQEQIVTTEFATADVVAQSVAELVSGQQQGLLALAEEEAIRAIDQRPDEALALMDEYRIGRSALNGLFLLGTDSTLVRSTGGIDVMGLPQTFWSAAEAAVTGGQVTVSDSILLPGGTVEVVAIIVPVYANPDTAANSPEGTPAAATEEAPAQAPSGALGAFYSVERMIAGYQPASGFSNGSGIAIALVSSSGRIVNVPGGINDPGQIFRDGDSLNDSITTALGGQRTTFTFQDPRGVERAAVAVPIPIAGNDWAVLVSVPSTTEYGPNRSLIEGSVLIMVGIVACLLLLSWVLASWLTRPFRRLTEQAELLAGGASVAIPDMEGPPDAAELGRGIREMADRLNAQIRDTESAREEIARQAERLRDLLRRTVRLQEDERRRIASDIHDAVSPLITGALYQSQAVRIARASGNGNGHDGHDDATGEIQGLREVSELLERAMRELHDVIFDLRPPDLDDIGIVAALQRHVAQVNRSGLMCSLEEFGEERRLPPEVRLAVYRIVQEALHNAIRHARADESLVRIEWLPDRMRVTIQDDGSGFDLDKAGRRAGLGLMSMGERAASIGATLDILSREGSGTAVVVERMNDDLDRIPESANGDGNYQLRIEEPAEIPELVSGEEQEHE